MEVVDVFAMVNCSTEETVVPVTDLIFIINTTLQHLEGGNEASISAEVKAVKTDKPVG